MSLAAILGLRFFLFFDRLEVWDMDKVREQEILTLAELTEIEFMRLYEEFSVSDAPEKRKTNY